MKKGFIDLGSLVLPPINPSRHKYEAGYVIGVGGSLHMPGAAALASMAVLRSGAGIVRLFTDAPAHLAPEIIREEYSLSRIQEEARRARAYFIGPGLGRDSTTEKRLKALLVAICLPSVLDGDALFFLAKNRSWKIPNNAILTPHQGEMEQLLKKPPSLKNCQEYVTRQKTTLILKGAPTIIFHPAKKPIVGASGNGAMATAGTGDVLTGILAGLLAQEMAPYQAALLGVYLHSLAGECAAKALTPYCMIASDLLDYLPTAFSTLLHTT